MLLTDDEIKEIFINEGESKYEICFAREVEAAILAKLASAQLPAPNRHGGTYESSPFNYYTADQLRQAFAQGAASQLQTLQEKNALLEGTLESRDRNIAALQAENERLKEAAFVQRGELLLALGERDAYQQAADKMAAEHKAERDALAAKLVPLTQEQVVEGFCKTPHQVQYVAVFDAGVRFAEAAHGIQAKGGQHEDA